MYCSILYFVFNLVQLVFSQSSCPDVQPVKNFNMTTFTAQKWYEIARYNDEFESTQDCSILTFNDVNEVILFKVRSTLNNNLRYYGGSIDFKDNQDGIILYHSKVFKDKSDNTIPVVVIAVDYNSYSVLYFCMYDADKKKKTDLAWILSTTKVLSPAAKTAIEDLFHSSNILDRSKFIWEKFTNAACKEDV